MDSGEWIHPAVRPRRIGLCGGTRIRPENALFAENLGSELAVEEGLVLVTGGFKCFVNDADRPSADWSFIKGTCEWLRMRGHAVEKRIETLLPDPVKEPPDIVRFKEGIIVNLQGRSLQARRFRLVGSVDTLVAVEGSNGTKEIIDLALALEKPILPLPFTCGAAATRWHENKPLICEWFDISEKTARMWETTALSKCTEAQIAAMSKSVKQYLLHQLRRKCFIMMPFGSDFLPLYDKAIKPAIETSGFLPIRTDQLDLVGDVVAALHGAIRTSACGLAVITGNNANVMYELGLAHAQGKHVILLCEFADGRYILPALPYDLRNESVVGYRGGEWASLEQAIRAVLDKLKGK